MNKHALLLTALAGIATAGTSAGAELSDARQHRLADIVAYAESAFQGRVSAIELDDCAAQGAHYHVDVRFPRSSPDRLARVDIDAASRKMSQHDARPLPHGSATLAEAASLVAAMNLGHILAVQAHASDVPHYDVDVRVPGGKIARFKIDAATRAIGWRQPAIVSEQLQ